MKFKLGDRVRLSKEGQEQWGNAPHQGGGGKGCISRYNQGGVFAYVVTWDNGSPNSYDDNHLQRVVQRMEIIGNELILLREEPD